MRLTEKDKQENHYFVKPINTNVAFDFESRIKADDKLGQLEDIEDEFEIDDLEDLRDRLTTYKFLANHEMSCVDVNSYNLMLEVLDEYHDIEKDWGIEISVLYKALKNKIYTINDGEHYVGFDLIEQDSFGDYYWNLISGNYYFKDYGKTWALNKNDLLQ